MSATKQCSPASEYPRLKVDGVAAEVLSVRRLDRRDRELPAISRWQPARSRSVGWRLRQSLRSASCIRPAPPSPRSLAPASGSYGLLERLDAGRSLYRQRGNVLPAGPSRLPGLGGTMTTIVTAGLLGSATITTSGTINLPGTGRGHRGIERHDDLRRGPGFELGLFRRGR